MSIAIKETGQYGESVLVWDLEYVLRLDISPGAVTGLSQ